MTDHVKKGLPIPCDTTCYDGSPGAIVAIEKCQRRVKAHTASCYDYEQWLLEYYGPPKRDSDITRKQDICIENLIRERDEALEKLEWVFQLCVATVDRFHEDGGNIGVPVTELREKLGFPPFENTTESPCTLAYQAGPPEPPRPDGVGRPLVLFPDSLKPLEGLIVHLSYPHISSGGASGKGDGSVHLRVDLPEDPLVAAEVIARLRHLCKVREPLTVLLWDAA